MAAPGVSRNLDSYEELRKLDLPLDTEPAMTFRPYLPGKQPAGRSTRNAKLAVARTAKPAARSTTRTRRPRRNSSIVCLRTSVAL